MSKSRDPIRTIQTMLLLAFFVSAAISFLTEFDPNMKVSFSLAVIFYIVSGFSNFKKGTKLLGILELALAMVIWMVNIA